MPCAGCSASLSVEEDIVPVSHIDMGVGITHACWPMYTVAAMLPSALHYTAPHSVSPILQMKT